MSLPGDPGGLSGVLAPADQQTSRPLGNSHRLSAPRRLGSSLVTQAERERPTGEFDLRRYVKSSPHRRRATLDEAAVFRGLSAGVITDLIDRLPLAHFEAEEPVYSMGEAGERVYLVLEGKVKIGSRARDGREYLSAIVGPHEMFGAVSVLDRAPRESNASAITRVVAATIDRDTLVRWLRRHPEAAKQMLWLLSREVRYLNARLAERFTDNVPARVADQLHLLAQQFGVRECGAIRLDHGLTQEEIGQLIGASREHVNVALGEFSRRGWIRLDGRSMLIFDLPKGGGALSAT